MTDTTENTIRIVPDLLSQQVDSNADRTVLKVDNGPEMTYREWDERSNGIARGLIDAGVERGDRVALFYVGMEWRDYLLAYMGGLKAGAALMHVNEPDTVVELMGRIGAQTMIHSTSVSPPTGFDGVHATIHELERSDTSPVDVGIEPTDLSNILFTSGTTGPAKAIGVPHNNMTYKRSTANFSVLGDLKPLIAPMPVSSTASVTTSLVALSLPATVVVCDRHDPERMAQLIEKYHVGSVMVTPYIAMRLIEAGVGDRHDLSCVDTISSASAPLPPPLRASLLAIFPNAEIKISYSSSETYSAVMRTTMSPDRPLSVGKPAPGSFVRITDEDRNVLPDGELGYIWLGADSPKRFYLDAPELNADVYDGRWAKTGDLGHIGADGELYLFDRARDAIPINGGLVSTIQVEAVLYDHPSVIDAAVMAVPQSDETAQVGVALALRDPRALDAVLDFAAERLDTEQMPTVTAVIDKLPRNHTGKILKRDLLSVLNGGQT